MKQTTRTPALAEAIRDLHDQPAITMRGGKKYTTVATRMEVFRRHFPEYGLETILLHVDDKWVRVRAWITREDGTRVAATGHAEEWRGGSQVNRTSALENAETSAIGRALSAFGLHGGEYASADEVVSALDASKALPTKTAIKPQVHALWRDLQAAEDADDAPMFHGVVEQYKDVIAVLPQVWSDAWDGDKDYPGVRERLETLQKHFTIKEAWDDGIPAQAESGQPVEEPPAGE